MMNGFLLLLIILVVIQFISYLWAYYNQSDKLTDLVYGGTFAILSLVFLWMSTFQIQHIIMTLLVMVWGIRLSAYLFMRINSMKRDIRFDEMRPSWSSFGKFWLLQSGSILIIFLPVWLVLTKELGSEIEWTFYLAALLSVVGFIIELIADNQKSAFKKNASNKGRPMIYGLYAWVRYPNYLGEILFWLGIYFATLHYISGWEHLAIISPLWISFLLIKVSGIPLLEENQMKSYSDLPEFKNYLSKTPKLFPLVY